jgi:hypothetical protein
LWTKKWVVGLRVKNEKSTLNKAVESGSSYCAISPNDLLLFVSLILELSRMPLPRLSTLLSPFYLFIFFIIHVAHIIYTLRIITISSKNVTENIATFL